MESKTLELKPLKEKLHPSFFFDCENAQILGEIFYGNFRREWIIIIIIIFFYIYQTNHGLKSSSDTP